jgi:hypothetical protein
VRERERLRQRSHPGIYIYLLTHTLPFSHLVFFLRSFFIFILALRISQAVQPVEAQFPHHALHFLRRITSFRRIMTTSVPAESSQTPSHVFPTFAEFETLPKRSRFSELEPVPECDLYHNLPHNQISDKLLSLHVCRKTLRCGMPVMLPPQQRQPQLRDLEISE